MPSRIAPLAMFALLAVFTGADVHAESPSKVPAAKPDKLDPLTPAKKHAVDAFVDSLELAPNWPRYVEASQQTFADDVRTGIVMGAQLDLLPADKRAKVDAVIDEMIPHIVQDMKAELLKVDAVAFYHGVGYDVYGKHFTTRELKDLTALYGSPPYHRAMPVIFEQRERKPESTDNDLRKLVGDADFDALAKAMRNPAYIKLMAIAPDAAQATSEYIGALVGKVSERVGKNYSPILLEKMKDIMEAAPEGTPANPPENAPTSVQVNLPATVDKTTQ